MISIQIGYPLYLSRIILYSHSYFILIWRHSSGKLRSHSILCARLGYEIQSTQFGVYGLSVRTYGGGLGAGALGGLVVDAGTSGIECTIEAFIAV